MTRHDAENAATERSSRLDVRNPVIALPAFRRIQALPREIRAPLCHLLDDLKLDASRRAEESWRKHKAPMAAYWKAVSVYAGHIRRAIGPDVPRAAVTDLELDQAA